MTSWDRGERMDNRTASHPRIRSNGALIVGLRGRAGAHEGPASSAWRSGIVRPTEETAATGQGTRVKEAGRRIT